MAQTTKNEFWLSVADLKEVLSGVEKFASTEALIRDIEKNLGPQIVFKKQSSAVPPVLVRQYLALKGFQYLQKVISFQMLKGGVAKTTSALNFGYRAAQFGFRVLFIDLDQQANLTFALGIEDESLPVWLDLVEKKKTISELIVNLEEGIDLIPSSLNNSVLDRVLLNGSRNWSQAVKAPLEAIRHNYDLVIVDTAPNISAINTAVTIASDQIILPINPDRFSILGLKKNLEDLKELKSEFGAKFEEKILFTKFDSRESLSKELLNRCIEDYEDLLLKNFIRTSSEVKSKIASGKTIYSTKSTIKEDYDLFSKELLGWE